MNPAEYVLQAYSNIFSLPVEQITSLGWTIPLPQFPIGLISNLFKLTIEQLQKDPVLVEIDGPLYVVGDIHGNIFDLCRVLIYCSPPPKSKLVFLGDYVDRGEFSIDVIILLFSLYCIYPKNIVLLRGNHEFQNINETYGFFQEITDQFHNTDLYQLSNQVFNYLPMAAIISGKIFAVHGGLSPDLKNISDINNFKKPITNYFNTFLGDLVWSDPSTEKNDYYRSSRGTGVTFGVNAVSKFLTATNLTTIVRAHQCVPLGIAKFGDAKVYTVFSCSNYTDSHGNRCGILLIDENLKFKSFSLPPLDIPTREKTRFATGLSSVGHTDYLALNLKLQDLQKHKVKSSDPQANLSLNKLSKSTHSRSTDDVLKKTSFLPLQEKKPCYSHHKFQLEKLPPLHPNQMNPV